MREKIVEMVINGTGVGSIQRYGDKRLKKTKKFAKPVNEAYLKELKEKKKKEEK